MGDLLKLILGMKKIKNRSGKGKRLEKFFAQELKKIFPKAETEIKPRIINLKKDFWGLFDGLTFIKDKRKFIFWQIKGAPVSNKSKEKFWKEAEKFSSRNIIILFIEKNKKSWKIYFQPKKYFPSLKDIKNLLK